MVQYLTFDPLTFLRSPHRQTVLAAIPLLLPSPPSESLAVTLSDGDVIVSLISTPIGWKTTDQTAVLLHGLDGSESSPYMARICQRLYDEKYRVVRVNYRGCGAGTGLARRCYTGGSDGDILAVLQRLRQDTPSSHITLIGFSLGGHIALRLAGILKQQASNYIKKLIALCPPVDLGMSAKMIGHPRNRLYEIIFVRGLIRHVNHLSKYFPDIPKKKWPRGMSVYEFDHIYTAPSNGYTGAEDYYRQCSSVDLVPHITVPTHILFAEDDTMIDNRGLDHLALPTNIQLWKTKHGGHLGFIGSPSQEHGTRWLEGVIMNWIRTS